MPSTVQLVDHNALNRSGPDTSRLIEGDTTALKKVYLPCGWIGFVVFDILVFNIDSWAVHIDREVVLLIEMISILMKAKYFSLYPHVIKNVLLHLLSYFKYDMALLCPRSGYEK